MAGPAIDTRFLDKPATLNRIIARFIDSAVINLAVSPVLFVIGPSADDGTLSSGDLLRFGLANLVLFVLYDVVCVARFGATLGKLMLRLRVVTTSGRAVRSGSSTMRASMYHVLTVLSMVTTVVPQQFVIVSVTILAVLSLRGAIRDPRGRAFWDHAADTRVITTPRGVPRLPS